MEVSYVKLTVPEIGSVEKHTQTQWVYENDEMVYRSVSYVAALYNIFDEIIVKTAAANRRYLNSLKVTIDVDHNLISVYVNYICGFQHADIYELGHINCNDNGSGTLEIKCEVLRNHMENTCSEGSEFWTVVSFKPYLANFNMTELEVDVVALMKKRVVDMAGILGKSVKVELDGKCVPVNSFTDYVSLYLQAASKSRSDPTCLPRIAETSGDGWEICVSLSEGQFQQVSFVNGVATIKGGTHVDYVTDQISDHLMAVANKKNTNAIITADTVKNCLWVFVNSLIDIPPAFDSPTKETLITCRNSFGSKCELTPKFLKKVEKSTLLHLENFKQSKDLKKTDGDKKQRVTGVSNLVDAREAGGDNSDKCTLILTVGDAAKCFAVLGVYVVGRDYYGVYSLRKELLNVSVDKYDKLFERNVEFRHIETILGLQHGIVYNSVKSLRYGHLMIMTDQADDDGSYLKGLLINFIHSRWPSLLRMRSFLVDPMIPIAKATDRNGAVMSFYSRPEYESWIRRVGRNTDTWDIRKYRQGLGSWTKEGVKEYFSDLDNHKKEFLWEDEKDVDAIKLPFSKDIEKRKDWLLKFKLGTYLHRNEMPRIKYSDFVNNELILFPMAKLRREIPSMVDGLKPCQRKVLFVCLKLNLVEPLSVSEIATNALWQTDHHYGVASLISSTIDLAQIIVGSNNINLLEQRYGDFGNRFHGGKYHAGSNCLYVVLSPITRYLFHKDDDSLLYRQSEFGRGRGRSIEPTWYMPIIPTVLVNGGEGTSDGWRTCIPKYKPSDIIANIMHLLNREPMEPMVPWYKGFKGTITKSATHEEGGGVSFTCAGKVENIDNTTFHVTELPVGQWTGEYMRKLTCSAGEEDFIEVDSNHGDGTVVDLKLVLSVEMDEQVSEESKLKKFNLTTTISTGSMYLFDSKGEIKKYDTPEQIIEEFSHLRLEFYEKRKKALAENLVGELGSLLGCEEKLTAAADKVDVGEIVKKVIGLRNQKIADVIDLMKASSKSLWVRDLKTLDRQLRDDHVPNNGLEISSSPEKKKGAVSEVLTVSEVLKLADNALEISKKKGAVSEVLKQLAEIGQEISSSPDKKKEAVSKIRKLLADNILEISSPQKKKDQEFRSEKKERAVFADFYEALL